MQLPGEMLACRREVQTVWFSAPWEEEDEEEEEENGKEEERDDDDDDDVDNLNYTFHFLYYKRVKTNLGALLQPVQPLPVWLHQGEVLFV